VGIVNQVGMLRRLHRHNRTSIPTLMLSEGVRSRTLLRNSEEDAGIREHLNRYIAECHASIARVHADHGHYAQAVHEQWLALSTRLSAYRLWMFCRGIARSIAIAIGAHRPRSRGS
jgi:hypothetical protein